MSDEPVAHIAEDGSLHPLSEHLRKTSELASSFAGKIGLTSLGELAGLLHDLGKHSDVFQAYLKSAKGNINPDEDEYVDAKGMRGKIDHSSAGAQLCWESLHKQNALLLLAGQIMSLCIASHHTGLIDCLKPDGSDSFTKRMAKSIDQTHLDEVRIKADGSIRNRVNDLLSSPLIENELRQRLELLFLDEHSGEIREFKLGLMVRFLFSTLLDADRLNSANRAPNAGPEWTVLIEKLEAYLAGLNTRNPVDKIRAEISSSCMDFARHEKGLFTLTVPTGGGKTLSSLRFALHHSKYQNMNRIVYVVPYTTIIDQNARVVRSIFKSTSNQSRMSGKQIVLEHHSNLTPEKDTWQSKILSENWDAPIIFTTAVQFLETLFSSGTRGARRMHQLANAVIIFDEIQTLPIRTIHLFNNAINFLVEQCNSTVVFCTATQPLLHEVDATKGAAKLSENHQMISDTGSFIRELRELRPVEMLDERKVGGWTDDEVVDCTREELKNAGSVLIIVNTKAQAREIYKKCREITEQVFHLSTSMCPAHRMHVLDKIKECLHPDNPKPVIGVSTQLIEAGVDVDFGTVIRYLAGLDAIAQAAGRCNRNGLRSFGKVLIVNPANENLDRLPDIRIAKEKTERVLDEFRNDAEALDRDLLSRTAMEQYYRYFFFERANEMTYPVTSREAGRDDSLFSLLSTNALSVVAYERMNKKAPTLSLRQSFMTAAKAFEVINAPTEGVIVPYGEEGKRIIADLSAASWFENKYDLLRRAQRYSVNMFPNDIKKLSDMGCIHEVHRESDILYLDARHYSDEFGASVEQVGQMEFLNG